MEQFVSIVKTENKIHDTPLLLIHGSWGSSTMWMQYSEILKNKGWDLYMPDLRGHGQSGGSVAGATMQNYVDDVSKVVSEHNLKMPIVIGHSLSGLVALMYAVQHNVKAVVAIDPSPTKEVQKINEKKEYPSEYSPMEAGMPSDPMEIMKVFPDISQEMLMKMKMMLGKESGKARSERKLGISIPKEKLAIPILFVGGELGESVPFGIGIKTAKAMSNYYGKDVLEIKGATHPGILLGEHSMETAKKIEEWMAKIL